MMIKNKTKKFIVSVLLILIIAPAVLFSAPKQINAYVLPVIDPANVAVNSKHTIIDIITGASTAVNTGHTITNALIAIAKQAVMVVEQRLLQEMTKSMVNWINSGFHGAPLFLQNSDSFFHDIAKTEIKNLINDFGYDPSRFPFGKQFALNTINAYKRAADADAAYSLSAVMNPIMADNFRNNFNTGGWNGFLINTQYPQNNYLGFNMIATQQLAQKLQGTVQNAAQKVQTTLNQGMGFLSPQSCPSNPAYNNGVNEFQKPSFKYTAEYNPPYNTQEEINSSPNPAKANLDQINYISTWYALKAGAQADWAKTNTCPAPGLVSTTPGSVAANQIFKAMGVDTDKTVLGSMVEGSLSAILNTLLSHFLDKGLSGIAGLTNSAPPADTWSYNGNTLETTSCGPGGCNYDYGNTGIGGTTLSGIDFSSTTGPQKVSISADGATSVALSGGKADYSIQTEPNLAVANAQIFSGTTLSITGVGVGTTSVTVKDSSSPAKTITINITVTASLTTTVAQGDLKVEPQNITANVGDTIGTTISGGTPDYTVAQWPDKTVASIIVSGTTLAISAVGGGTTSVVIQDSSIPIQTFTVHITVGTPTTLEVAPESISTNIGGITSVAISGGTPPYIVAQKTDATVASMTFSRNTITVTGVGAGDTSVVIQDSSLPQPQIAGVSITVNPAGTGTGGGVSAVDFNPPPQTSTVGGTINLLIPSGYTMAMAPNPVVAKATLVGTNLSITGISPGPTSIILADSSGKTVTIDIVISSASRFR